MPKKQEIFTEEMHKSIFVFPTRWKNEVPGHYSKKTVATKTHRGNYNNRVAILNKIIDRYYKTD